MNEWIKTVVKLPEPEERVLITWGSVQVAWRTRPIESASNLILWNLDNGTQVLNEAVKFWRPLPEMPDDAKWAKQE